MTQIYLDNAATTPLLDEVIDAMVVVMKNNFRNPSSTHTLGQEAKTILEETREKLPMNSMFPLQKLSTLLAELKPII